VTAITAPEDTAAPENAGPSAAATDTTAPGSAGPPADALPRRISLGIALPQGGAFTAEGMGVAAVVPGSMAAEAGLEPGDVVTAVDGMPLRSMEELRAVTRAVADHAAVTIAVSRGGAPVLGRARVAARPAEHIEGHSVRYEHVLAADGARLRTIVTRPVSGGPHPAVLFLQGIGRDSLDFGAAPSAPIARLLHGWAAAGLVTMRVEKRGVGDSDGAEVDFDTELADDRAALHALAADPAVDPHSVGGMIAPLLAAEALAGDAGDSPVREEPNTIRLLSEQGPSIRGVVLFGTSAARWFDCLAASTRRQLALRGAPEDEIAGAVERERREGFGVRTAEYHAQLQARDLGEAWDRTSCDVLVLAGQHDWVVGEDEQRAVHDRIAARRPGTVEMLFLPGTDHWMTRHADLEESLRNAGRGAFDERLVTAPAAWMRRRARRP
jgi:dienelactone hydrolase